MTDDRIPMTREGYEKLKAEVSHLNDVKMIEVTKRVATARDMGDLSENAEYHAAREDQGMLQAGSTTWATGSPGPSSWTPRASRRTPSRSGARSRSRTWTWTRRRPLSWWGRGRRTRTRAASSRRRRSARG